MYPNFHPTIIIKLQDNGSWYGRVEGVFDKSGNELDASGATAAITAQRLEDQLTNQPIDIRADYPLFR